MAKRREKKTRGSSGSERASGPGGGPPLPGWLVVVACGVVTLVLFREFIFSGRMLYGSDTLSLGYAVRAFYADAVAGEGVFPRWMPTILGGTPFLEALSGGDSLYPTALLLFVMEPFRALGWKLVLHVFLGGLFMYGWVRALGRSRAASLVAGLAFSVAPFFVTLVHPGHDGKLFVTALTPLLFWAMEWTFVRRGLLPFVGVSLVVALVILTTHFQLAYFLFGAAGVYYMFRTLVWRGREGAGAGSAVGAAGSGSDAGGDGPRDGSRGAGRGWAPALSRYGLFLAASIMGASVAGVQLVPAFDYVLEFSRRTATTTRASPEENRVYASSWSLHPEEAVSFVVPEFAGNDAGGADWAESTYWGRNPFKDNHEYAGFVVLMLALAGFFGAPRKKLRWFLAGLGVVAVLYALGTHTPLWGLLYAFLPGIRLFRAPSMVSFLFGFSAISLMAFGVDRLLALARSGEGEEGETGRTLVRVLAAVVGVLLLGTVLAASGVLFELWTGLVYPEVDAARLQTLETLRPFIVRGCFTVTLLAAGVAGIAWAARSGRLKPLGVFLGLAVLVFLDGFRVSTSFIQTLEFERWAAPDPIIEELLARREAEPPFRVASLARAGQSVRPTIFGLELATGHHPNDLARYRELIGMRGSGIPQNLFNPNVYGILNVRYLIWPDAERGGLPDAPPPVARTQLRGQVYQTLYRLPTLPRARLVADARVVPDERAVETILSEDFDPATTILLSREPPVELGGGPVEGEATWEERGINRQRLRVSSDRSALLVLADNWFPAWRATVDGEEVPVLRAYHTVRAVPVGPGEHTVELTYDSPLVERSLALSVGSFVVLLLVGAFSWARTRRGHEPGEG